MRIETWLIPLCIVLSALLGHEYRKSEPNDKTRSFAENCDENKGIAVRDVHGKLRCVPMFAALKDAP